MDPLLFLGREFLRKLSGADVDAEEREAYREALAVYSESEQGRAAPRLLIGSFNRLAEGEYSEFAWGTMLWLLDWIATQDRETADLLDPRVFVKIWRSFDEAPVRLRVVEVAVQWESTRLRPEASILRTIFEIADADRELVRDALRLDDSEYAEAVLRGLG